MKPVRIMFGFERHRDAARDDVEAGVLGREVKARILGGRTLFLDFAKGPPDCNYIPSHWQHVLTVDGKPHKQPSATA